MSSSFSSCNSDQVRKMEQAAQCMTDGLQARRGAAAVSPNTGRIRLTAIQKDILRFCGHRHLSVT